MNASDHSAHDEHVRLIQSQIRRVARRKQRVRIYHGTTNSTRLTTFEVGSTVDVSQLNRVIEINAAERYALVEPNVPMDALVEATLAYDLMPLVVPEFPGITIGGAVQGGAEESSSFRHGLVHDTCLEYEMVLGNGELVTASPTSHPHLFAGTAASYGSLGILTCVKLRLIPAKPYVRVRYDRVASAKEALDRISKLARTTSIGFLDGLLFAPDRGVVISGQLSDRANLPIARFSRAWDDWHYLHAQAIACKNETYEELVPIRDYLFRYDRGAFWMARYGIKLLHVPFNRLTRLLLNVIVKTRASYRILHATELAQRYIIQDFNLPIEAAETFIEQLDETVRIYPLWLCPLRPGNQSGWSANGLKTELVMNIGVWGSAPADFTDFVSVNRDLEQRVAALGGRKMLYAQAYYPKAEFWALYDRPRYDELRTKYHADVIFPSLYEKTHVARRYSPSVWRGLWRLIWSPRNPSAH